MRTDHHVVLHDLEVPDLYALTLQSWLREKTFHISNETFLSRPFFDASPP